jgi:hypothetical protein
MNIGSKFAGSFSFGVLLEIEIQKAKTQNNSQRKPEASKRTPDSTW